MRFSVLPRGEIFTPNGSRLDAEAFDPLLLDLERSLRSTGAAPLRNLVSFAPTASFAEDPEGWERYIDISSIDNRDGFVIPTDYRIRDLPSHAKTRVRHLDLMVSNVRPHRGAIAFVPIDADGCVATSGVTAVRAKANVDARVLFAWLRSSHVRDQLVRRSRNSMYPAVGPDDVLDVLVPRFSNAVAREVSDLVTAAENFRATVLTHGIEQRKMLSEFLTPYGVPPSPLEGHRNGIESTVVSRADCFGPASTGRIDVEFHRSEFAEFAHRAATLGEVWRLGDLYSLTAGPGRLPGDGEVAVVKQAALTNMGVNWSAVEFEPGLNSSRTVLKGGELLLASAAHEVYYLGRKVDIARAVPADCVVNHVVPELIVGRPKSGERAALLGSYVAAFLRHNAGLHQVQRCIRGLRGGHVYGFDLEENVVVPAPPGKWLEDFERSSKASEQARLGAERSVQEAVLRVESAAPRHLTSTK